MANRETGRFCKLAAAALITAVLALVMSLVATHDADAAPWVSSVDGKRVEYSTYGPYEGESITATGRKITNSTKYVAVPYQLLVSKKTWKSHKSRSYRVKHFYYHQKLTLKKGICVVTVQVEDCGGFYGYGGAKRYRLFDLTPAVFNALGVGKGTGVLKWRY